MHATASVMVALVSVLPFAVGCYGTREAPVTAVAGLKSGNRSGELLVKQGPFGIHVGPRSWVRFCLRDGSRTPWFNAGKLRVNDVLVITSRGEARPVKDSREFSSLRWDDVASVEVNDLDVVESIAGVTAGTGFVVLAMTTEVLLLAGLQAISGGHLHANELGLTRAAVDLVTEEALKRPDEDPEIASPATNIPPVDSSLAPCHHVGSEATCLEDQASPLFSSRAWRRDLVLFTLASEAGLDAGAAPLSVGAVTVGLRLRNVFEVGFGARSWLGTPGHTEPARPVSVPFLRFALHLDLDAARRVAVTIGSDLGGTSEITHARFSFGLRVRLTDHLQIGLYPWNPTGSTQNTPTGSTQNTPAGTRQQTTSHLHLLELAWLL